MKSCIAMHSYKGGTGKSTMGSNISALLTSRGYNVLLLDMDVYAPSLQTYFNQNPERWINDFLFGSADFEDVVYDLSHLMHRFYPSNPDDKTTVGKFFVSFSNSSKQEIAKLDGAIRNDSSKVELLRKFIQIKENSESNKKVDYIIIDTSPGIRYWSINSLAIADLILLSLKMDAIDIEGTRKLVHEIYTTFRKLGVKSYLLLNRTAGYCNPSNNISQNGDSDIRETYSKILSEQSETITKLKKDLQMEIISSIPCYCDIQFDSQEFMTVLKHPDHPFTLMMDKLVDEIENISTV